MRVVALERNRGFAAAVNVGIERSDAEYVALVNNDVELEPHWLEIVVAALDRDPGVGSVASKLLEWSRRNVLDGAGDLVGWDGYCVRRGKGERDRGQYDRSPRVLSACAAAALYRRRALDDVGPFDESFFAYIEDVDWGLRAQLAGWDCVYEGTAVAVSRRRRLELAHVRLRALSVPSQHRLDDGQGLSGRGADRLRAMVAGAPARLAAQGGDARRGAVAAQGLGRGGA